VIWELVKRDPAWRAMPYSAAASLLIWPFGSDKASETFGAIAVMLPLAVLFIFQSQIRQRYTLLQATLPIAGRQLFLARVASVTALIWLPILSVVAAMAVGGVKWTWVDSLPLLGSGAMAMLGFMLVQSIRVRALDPPVWLLTTVFVGAVAVLPQLAMADLFFPRPVVWMIAVVAGCAVASTALFLKAWAGVPKSFQLAPDAPISLRLERAGPAAHSNSWWPVFRELYFGSWQPVVWFSIIASTFWFQGWGAAFNALFFITASFFQYCKGLRWLHHLPISARKLLWVVWLPTVVAILVGVLGYAAVGSSAPSHPLTIAPSKPEGSGINAWQNVKLPAEYWRWARGGVAPEMEAPWGERYRPETTQWLGLAFYNPYSVGSESSRRFVEWQFLRATQAVYGQSIPASQAAILPRMKAILQQPKALSIIAALSLLYYLVQVCALHFSGWKRLWHTPSGYRLAIGAAPMLVALFVMLPIPSFGSFGNTPYVLEVLVLHLSRTLPDNLWLLAPMALAPMVGLCWLAEKLFGEMEFGLIEAQVRSEKGAV
jgi:hypothetical protein